MAKAEPKPSPSVEEELEPPKCRAHEMGCQMGPAENGYFCAGHWRIIPLDLRHKILRAGNLSVSELNKAITGCLSVIRRHQGL